MNLEPKEDCDCEICELAMELIEERNRVSALTEALGALVTEINRQPDPAAVPARVWSAKVVAEHVLGNKEKKHDNN